MHDRLTNGRTIRAMAIVDDFARECLALEIGFSFGSRDVFVVGFDFIYEYAHGGTAPINTLGSTSYFYGFSGGCSVNPNTGDLAVAVSSVNGGLAVFKGAQGAPTIYTDPDFATLWSCGYDASGNLFASGFAVSRAKKSSSLQNCLKAALRYKP
jgi:hypothetical protein